MRTFHPFHRGILQENGKTNDSSILLDWLWIHFCQWLEVNTFLPSCILHFFFSKVSEGRYTPPPSLFKTNDASIDSSALLGLLEPSRSEVFLVVNALLHPFRGLREYRWGVEPFVAHSATTSHLQVVLELIWSFRVFLRTFENVFFEAWHFYIWKF